MHQLHPIEREIEFEHVDPPLADEAEQAPPLVRSDQRFNSERVRDAARGPRARLGIRAAAMTDLRIETARGCGHEIDGNRLPVVRVGIVQRFGVRLSRHRCSAGLSGPKFEPVEARPL